MIVQPAMFTEGQIWRESQNFAEDDYFFNKKIEGRSARILFFNFDF